MFKNGLMCIYRNWKGHNLWRKGRCKTSLFQIKFSKINVGLEKFIRNVGFCYKIYTQWGVKQFITLKMQFLLLFNLWTIKFSEFISVNEPCLCRFWQEVRYKLAKSLTLLFYVSPYLLKEHTYSVIPKQY